MKKYTVLFEPEQVERLQDVARRRAVQERRTVSWLSLVREATEQLLAKETGGQVEVVSASGGGR